MQDERHQGARPALLASCKLICYSQRLSLECDVAAQTREALAHALSAECPIVVALTKCDLPGADPPRVRKQLLAEGLQLEEAGGDVQVLASPACPRKCSLHLAFEKTCALAAHAAQVLVARCSRASLVHAVLPSSCWALGSVCRRAAPGGLL